jgi:hypothetical protein
MRDHMARFEWPGEDQDATDVTSEEALGAYRRPLLSPNGAS